MHDADVEEPRPFSGNDSIDADSDSDSDVNPITLVASRQISRSLSLAQQQDETSTRFIPAVKNMWERLKKNVYPSFFLDHLDRGSFRVSSRTWLHCWFTILLICIGPARRWEGGAAYLATIIALINPAGGDSVVHCAVDAICILFTTTIAYMGSIIIMAINHRIRGYPTHESVARAIFTSGECAVGDFACVSAAMLDGRFINSKTNAVMAIGFFFTQLAIICLNVDPRMVPFFRIPANIGIISATINILNANHLPFFIPWTVSKNVFLPVFMVLASKMVLTIAWFPTTAAATVVARIRSQFAQNSRTLSSLLDDISKATPGSEEYAATAGKFMSSFHASPLFSFVVGRDMPLLKYEFSYSRLDPDDISEYSIFVQRLASANSTLGLFFNEFKDYRQTIVENVKRKTFSERRNTQSPTSRSSVVHPLQNFPTRKPTFGKPLRHRKKTPWLNKHLNKEYLEIGTFEKEFKNNIEKHKHTFDEVESIDRIYTLLLGHYVPILSCSARAVNAVSDWIYEANQFRITALVVPSYRNRCLSRQLEMAEVMQAMLTELDKVLEEITSSSGWIESELVKMPELKQNQIMYALSQDIFFGYLVERSIALSRKMCRWCVFLDKTRPVPMYMFPFQSDNSVSKRADVIKYHELNNQTSTSTTNSTSDSSKDMQPSNQNPYDGIKLFQPVKNAQRRNPDSTPPRNIFHLIGTALVRCKNIVMGETGIFLVKKAAVGLIPAILYMNRPTLRFAYGYRILWVCIMATLTASPRAGDCIYALFVRFIMTIFGGLVGTVCWYISTGKGLGNPYGFGATAAVALIFIAYFRHFSMLGGPGPVPQIVFSITWVLVLCMSFLDHKMPTPGLMIKDGYDIFWIRLVSVAAGLLIGFTATIFHTANTTKLTVRRQIATQLKVVGDLQATIVNFGLQRYDDENVHQSLVKDLIIGKMGLAARGFAGLKVNMAMLVFEPPLTGFWPVNNYNLLVKLLHEVAYMQSIFYAILNGIPSSDDTLRGLEVMGMLDSGLLAGFFSVVYMTSNSIVSGEPLPTITPGHLAKDHLALLQGLRGSDDPREFLREMSRTRVGRSLVTSSHCAELFYRRMDGILVLIKGLCGELFDFDPRVNEYTDLH